MPRKRKGPTMKLWSDGTGLLESLKPVCVAFKNGGVDVFPGRLFVGSAFLIIDEPVVFRNSYVDGCAVVAIDNPTNECFRCDGLTFPDDLEDYGGEECIPAGCARLALLSPGVSISDERFADVHIVEYLNLREVDLPEMPTNAMPKAEEAQ